MTGGGSGGHITPLLAVAHELKLQQKDAQIIFVGQRGDNFADVAADDKNIDKTYLIEAGKLRRYHGEGIKQLFDFKTLFLNIRDSFKVIVGLWQSFWLLRKLRPDVIFVKGGFVGVPVGLSAAILRIPYITHDSDAVPGLANRIIARWAKKHTVALPKEIYAYPAAKTISVGVPLSHQFVPFSKTEVEKAKIQLGLSGKSRVLLITGGGLGAKRINEAILACAQELLERYKDLTIIHIAGRNHESEVRSEYQKNLLPESFERVVVKGFITNLYLYSGIADVIVTRAGATSLAEFAAQQKACVMVPNPFLTGGHQLKNAKVLENRRAVRVVSEDVLADDDHALMPAVVELLDDHKKAQKLGENLGQLARPDAAEHIAEILLQEAVGND